MTDTRTVPADPGRQDPQVPKLVLNTGYRDELTGALFVHKDMREILPAYQAEWHVAPTSTRATLGDVESWAAYIARYGTAERTYATWSATGIRATLDYHTSGEPGRDQWHARYDFVNTLQLGRWRRAIERQNVSHANMVELLEDSGSDIVEPDQAEVLDILRTLRVTTKSRGDTEIRQDGTTSIKWHSDAQVRGSKSGTTEMPQRIKIHVPALEGYFIDDKLSTVCFAVRIRASVDPAGQIGFRLSCPELEMKLDELRQSVASRAQSFLDEHGMELEILRSA